MREAKRTQYKPEILEKVHKLLDTLKQFMEVPYLRDRLVLKGGTALNLFYFDNIPRMSVDIDLNYIGHLDRSVMLEERPIINDAISQILQQNQFELYRNPAHHAGGKMVWRYDSVLDQKGNLEIDLNYMYRQPLWPVAWQTPKILFNDEAVKIPVLDLHELASGKLSALFSRHASRDLFDAHYLLTQCDLDNKKLRLAFVTYLAMTDIDIAHLQPDSIDFDTTNVYNQLLPVLRQQELPRNKTAVKTWATNLLTELREALVKVVPFEAHEIDFINRLRNAGEIKPELITEDKAMMLKITQQPALQWVINKKK